MEEYGLRARVKRFPSVQHRSAGQFVVLHSNDKTVTDRCACFMCGEQFSERKKLKRHFSACAKNNYNYEALNYSIEAGTSNNVIFRTKHGKDEIKGENIVVGSKIVLDEDTMLLSQEELDVKIYNQRRLKDGSSVVSDIRRPKQRSDSSKWTVPDQQYPHSTEHDQYIKHKLYKDMNDNFDAKDKTKTDDNSFIVNTENGVPVKRKRSREIENNCDRSEKAKSKKLTRAKEITDVFIDRNRGCFENFGKNKSSQNESKTFSSIFGCSLCDAVFSNKIALLNHHRRHMNITNGSQLRDSHREFVKVFDSAFFNRDRSDVLDKEARYSKEVCNSNQRKFDDGPTSNDVGPSSNQRNLLSEDSNDMSIVKEMSVQVKQKNNYKHLIKLDETPSGEKGRDIPIDRSDDDEAVQNCESKGHDGQMVGRNEFKNASFEDIRLLSVIEGKCRIDKGTVPCLNGDSFCLTGNSETQNTTKKVQAMKKTVSRNATLEHKEINLKTIIAQNMFDGTNFNERNVICGDKEKIDMVKIRHEHDTRASMGDRVNIEGLKSKCSVIDKQKEAQTTQPESLLDNINVNEVMLYLRRNLTAMNTP